MNARQKLTNWIRGTVDREYMNEAWPLVDAAIAEAVAAERERCAQIVERENLTHCSCQKCVDTVLDAIRTPQSTPATTSEVLTATELVGAAGAQSTETEET